MPPLPRPRAVIFRIKHERVLTGTDRRSLPYVAFQIRHVVDKHESTFADAKAPLAQADHLFLRPSHARRYFASSPTSKSWAIEIALGARHTCLGMKTNIKRTHVLLCSISAIAAFATPPTLLAASCQIKQLAEFQLDTTNNRPTVDGTVNGQRVKILIDTGSSISTINGALARQLGLKTVGQTTLHLYGVGGEKHVDAAQIKKLQFGNFILTDLAVAVMSPKNSAATGAREGVFSIGTDLLSQYTVEFDFAKHVMRLLMPQGCKPEQLVYWSKTFSIGDMEPNRVANTFIETRLLLNGKSIDAFLDSGAQVSWVTTYGARLAGVTNEASDHPTVSDLRGSNGVPVSRYLGNFETISIGDDETVHNVKLWVADLFAAATAADAGSRIAKPVAGLPNLIIGCDFFMAHRMIASFKDRKILFTYNGGPIFQASGTPPSQKDRAETASDGADDQ